MKLPFLKKSEPKDIFCQLFPNYKPIDFLDTISTRRTVRDYNLDAVPVNHSTIINEIAELALATTPSGKNQNARILRIVEDSAKLQELSEAHKWGKYIGKSFGGILISSDKNLVDDDLLKYRYDLQDAAALTMNTLNISRAYGLGSSWVGLLEYQDLVKKLFDLRETEEAVAFIPFGVPRDLSAFSSSLDKTLPRVKKYISKI